MNITINIIDKGDSSLTLKLNPREYFYPYITVRSDDLYDKEEGLSFKEFQLGKKIINMLGGNKYKNIFRRRLAYSFYNYLRVVEDGAEFEFKGSESLEQKVAQNENLIFELIKKLGPGAFRYSAILEKVQKWCDEKDIKNIGKLEKALKEHGKVTSGKISYSSFEQRYYFLVKYPTILEKIKLLKKDITLKRKTIKDDKELKKEIIEKWTEESKWLKLRGQSWFELILKLAKKEKEKPGGQDFITFVKKSSPRELAIGMFSEVIFLSPDTIDKILRKRKDILKMMSTTWDSVGHRF